MAQKFDTYIPNRVNGGSRIMKRFIILLILFAFSISAQAGPKTCGVAHNGKVKVCKIHHAKGHHEKGKRSGHGDSGDSDSGDSDSGDSDSGDSDSGDSDSGDSHWGDSDSGDSDSDNAGPPASSGPPAPLGSPAPLGPPEPAPEPAPEPTPEPAPEPTVCETGCLAPYNASVQNCEIAFDLAICGGDQLCEFFQQDSQDACLGAAEGALNSCMAVCTIN